MLDPTSAPVAEWEQIPAGTFLKALLLDDMFYIYIQVYCLSTNFWTRSVLRLWPGQICLIDTKAVIL